MYEKVCKLKFLNSRCLNDIQFNFFIKVPYVLFSVAVGLLVLNVRHRPKCLNILFYVDFIQIGQIKTCLLNTKM